MLFKPGLLEGAGFGIKDTDTGEVQSAADIKRLLVDHAQLTQFLYDFDRGIITVSLTEYNQLPAVLLDAVSLYREAKGEAEKQQWEKMKPT